MPPRPATDGKSRRTRGWTALALLALLLWGMGLLLFIAKLPGQNADAGERADAIVVLTGGSLRLEAGLALLAADRGEQLFISGVSRGTAMPDLLPSPESARLANRITPGHEARDTRGNALETARWMREQGYHSLLLVTSGYHMPRSLLEFRGILPAGTRIVPHPVFPEHVKADEWFRWPGTALLLIGEYNKFLVAGLRRWTVAVLDGSRVPEEERV